MKFHKCAELNTSLCCVKAVSLPAAVATPVGMGGARRQLLPGDWHRWSQNRSKACSEAQTCRPRMQAGMSDCTHVVQGDFCKMPFANDSFDAVFSVEATCHAGQVQPASSRASSDHRLGNVTLNSRHTHDCMIAMQRLHTALALAFLVSTWTCGCCCAAQRCVQ